MMNKKDKTEFLFSRIGEIDDSLIDEALTYKREHRKNYNFGMLAACLALVFVIAVAMPILRRFEELGDNKNSDVATDVPKTYDSLDELLSDSYGGNFKKLDSFESLSYVGSASIVWMYKDSGEVYVKQLSADELETIGEHLGEGEEVGERSPEFNCLVWILNGEGKVVSPYLKENAGNEGFEVFDYEAEIIPDEDLINCISDILH